MAFKDFLFAFNVAKNNKNNYFNNNTLRIKSVSFDIFVTNDFYSNK